MTLAGLSLAIGPLIDTAIICLENTHRHLGLGATVAEAAFLGSSEVALPELVASLLHACWCWRRWRSCPASGQFLFLPMALAVTFAMVVAFLLSRSFVPARCAAWLRPHRIRRASTTAKITSDRNAHEFGPPRGRLGRLRDRWESLDRPRDRLVRRGSWTAC